MSLPAYEVHGAYAVTWLLQPPTPLEVWLSDNFCHGPGHVLSHQSLVIASRLQERMTTGFSGVEGSQTLRNFEMECTNSFETTAARLPYSHWLLVFRALRNALQTTGHPWIPNYVADLGLSLSQGVCQRTGGEPNALLTCRIPPETVRLTLGAISNLVVSAYLSALRRRVEKGQSLQVPSLPRYMTGKIREPDMLVSGRGLEPDIEAVDARIETPTPTTMQFAEDGELDVVPLWFGHHATAFGDERLFGDPSACNPWWLAFMSFPRSFPSELVDVSLKDVTRVRALLNATPALAHSQQNHWATRMGVLLASEQALQTVPIDEILGAEQVMLLELRGGVYAIDLGAASNYFRGLFAPGAGGPNANASARRFELLVQDTVDFTPWRPEGRLRNLIGRKVKDNRGNLITDIDAVAAHEDVLILIDCKNHSEISDTFAGVRNRRDTYAKQAALWSDKVRRIIEVRDSLGIPARARIEGVVVVPKAGFMDSGIATEEVAGMTRVMGIWDFYQRLST